VLFRAAGALGRGGPLTLTTLRHYKATEPLGRLLAGSLDTGESLGRSAFVRLANAGAALLRSAASRNGPERGPLPARLDRASRELEDVAVMSAAVAAYRSAERATADGRRALASALSSSNPAGVGRAKRLLEAAEEAKRAALYEGAAGLLHGEPEEPPRVPPRAIAAGAPQAGVLAKTEQPAATERPATTGASFQRLVLQLRQTRRLVERIKQAAADLHDLSSRADVPEHLRRDAGASAAAVEEAVQAFRRAVGVSDDEDATQAARFTFEQRVMGIVAAHQNIHLALAGLSAETAVSRPAERAAPVPPAPPRD
jgi:hypothetical protein